MQTRVSHLAQREMGVGGVLVTTPDETGSGRSKLWGWFGLDRASFAVMPRVLIHAMPDEWQGKMADLLIEFEETFPGLQDLPNATITAKRGNKFTSWPSWLLNYRRPHQGDIDAMRPLSRTDAENAAGMVS